MDSDPMLKMMKQKRDKVVILNIKQCNLTLKWAHLPLSEPSLTLSAPAVYYDLIP